MKADVTEIFIVFKTIGVAYENNAKTLWPMHGRIRWSCGMGCCGNGNI